MDAARGGILSLPFEILCLILQFLDTTNIYPACFVVCRQFLRALKDGHSWELRCARDLDVHEAIPSSTWMDTYKENLLVWDPKFCTLPAKERLQLKNQLAEEYGKPMLTAGLRDTDDFVPSSWVINRNVVTWNDAGAGSVWVAIRAKRYYASGVNSFVLKILNTRGAFTALGVVQQHWDPRVFGYQLPDKKYASLYWVDGSFWDVSGSGREDSWPSKPRLITGDEVGITVDFDSRRIHFFVNDQWRCSQPMKPDMTKLWPSATFHRSGESVELRRAPNFKIPPEAYM